MASDSSPLRTDGIFSIISSGVLVSLSITPKARTSTVGGIVDSPDGPALRVRITESPEKGKANAAVIKLLSREWKILKKNISVARGGKRRRKLLLVEGESPALLSDLQRWVKHHSEGD